MEYTIRFGCDGCCDQGSCEAEVEDKDVQQSPREACSGEPNCECESCSTDDGDA